MESYAPSIEERFTYLNDDSNIPIPIPIIVLGGINAKTINIKRHPFPFPSPFRSGISASFKAIKALNQSFRFHRLLDR